MALIRPRITDYHDIALSQAQLDFAIPFLDEDVPLYVDPFLLWKSPSQQDNALHTSVINSFNHLGFLLAKDKDAEAREILIAASECEEVGLGHSQTRRGKRLGQAKADEILNLFRAIPQYAKSGFTHFEEAQLFVAEFSKDRISDICCSFIKSFLIDYTQQECTEVGIPVVKAQASYLYDYRQNRILTDVPVALPVNPENGQPILFVPKRWLRFNPWINFEDYFKDYCPRDEIFNPGEPEEPVKILRFNRDHYGLVEGYIRAKERTQEDCHNDPLFKQIPVISAKRKLSIIEALPTGKEANADKVYEDNIATLLASLLYPHLDFAEEQSRTDNNVLIRDLIFYNNRSIDFLQDIYAEYGNRQLVFEMKNVKAVNSDHINQLNRYLDEGIGKFGVLLTRNPLSRAMFKNTIDLWAGQRKCIIALTDEDLALMVNVFESRQRAPYEVLKRSYINFRRACPS